MREQEYEQGVGDPFDSPVAGQSLTDTPGNYPWEHEPQFTDPEEITEYLWVTMHKKQFTEELIAMLDAGVPVEAIGRTVLFGGFMEGKFYNYRTCNENDSSYRYKGWCKKNSILIRRFNK